VVSRRPEAPLTAVEGRWETFRSVIVSHSSPS
jgi:hypothetical protein